MPKTKKTKPLTKIGTKGLIEVTFEYSAELVKECKKVPFAWFDGKKWLIPAVNTPELHHLFTVLGEKIPKLHPKHMFEFKDYIHIYVPYDPDMVEKLREVAEWNKPHRCWRAPTQNLPNLIEILGETYIPDHLLFVAEELSEKKSVLANTYKNVDSNFDVTGTRYPLKPWQRACVEYVSKAGNTLISDGCGIGKTLESLACIEHMQQYPCVVVCEPKAKIDWASHAPTNRTVQIIQSKKPETLYGDIVIVSQAVLHDQTPHLTGYNRSLIVDESSNFSNKSLRSKAVIKLADKTPGLKLCLSATPVMNGRKAELYNELRILGYHKVFGNKMNLERMSNKEIHLKLAETGYIRRTLKDIYDDLEELEFFHQEIEVDLSEYVRVEYELKQHFKELRKSIATELGLPVTHPVVHEQMKNQTAPYLVLLGKLRLEVGLAKIPYAVEYLNKIIEDPTEKVVVFTYHREVANQLMEQLGCEGIVGGISELERQRIKDDFQTNPDTRFIVCNIKAAAKQVTLSSGTRTVFVETGFLQEELIQAGSRAHGRADNPHPAPAYVLVAVGSVDEQMRKAREGKVVNTEAIVDGKEDETYFQLIIEELTQNLL